MRIRKRPEESDDEGVLGDESVRYEFPKLLLLQRLGIIQVQVPDLGQRQRSDANEPRMSQGERMQRAGELPIVDRLDGIPAWIGGSARATKPNERIRRTPAN